MAKGKITLFVDIVSPFAYLGFYALKNFPVFQQCEITYVPIFLGGLMRICDNRPPLQIKNKDKWINKERIRWAQLFNIPVAQQVPDGFPANTITVQRALCALQLSKPETLRDAIAALFQSYWVERKAVNNPDVLAAALAGVVSEQEARDALKRTAEQEVKDTLAKNTDRAFESGAFGLPWFEATNEKGETEGFWGFDHLGQVVDHLGLERPTSGGWKALL